MRNGRRILRGIFVVFAVIVAASTATVFQFRRRIRSATEALYTDASVPSSGIDLETIDAPNPVSRYFRAVLEDGDARVDTVRLEQRGEFRLGGQTGRWRPFSATQHVSTDPPAFVWDARIHVVPFLPARVLDRYARGEGLLRARLCSVIPVASAGPSTGMNEGELQRYLAEAVWFPTGLLPGCHVEWDPIDDTTARATLTHAGVSASLTFHFDENDLVERVTGKRYRQEDDSFGSWVGEYSSYTVRNGRVIPTHVDVGWKTADGVDHYVRATVEDIDHHEAVLDF